MSLSYYENSDVIVQLNEPQYGQVFRTEDLGLLPYEYVVPSDPSVAKTNVSQVHIYSFYGDYIAGDHNASYLLHDPATNSFLINVAETFRQANIRRGSYIVAVNLFKPIWGSPDKSVVYVKEISPDRTEIKFTVPSDFVVSGEINGFKQTVAQLSTDGVLNNLVVDFGFNRLGHVLLAKFDQQDPSALYVKLYKPIDDDVVEKNTAWFGLELMSPYIDTVILTSPIVKSPTNALRGANYDIDVNQWSSNSTIFKSWNDLLDSDAPTSQRVIDSTLSGSAYARLNIDYTDFSNFVFYSSAEERVENFYYKLGLIESYNGAISVLQNSTGSLTAYVSSSVVINQNRINAITSNFDSFERWLYYEGTSSIFTHDISGSIKPFPKYLSGGKYILHHTTSSLGLAWYNGTVASASAYDQQNTNRLWWSIPEHILMDDGNDDYVLFVDMVGQHFDNLYAYTKALTAIHERDEHPDRGASNDLLYPIAKSFGWNLQNTRQLSDLWFYKTGQNQQGQYESTGSLFSLSGETQTQTIWRRIVNNLPYLLKTKGTERSVKALMSIYGIPNTIISIKEYGGPSIGNDYPQLVEDRYAYALNFEGSQSIWIPRKRYWFDSGSLTGVIPVDTLFRFRTTYSGSLPMSLYSVLMDSGSAGVHKIFDIQLHHAKSKVGGDGKVSGSYSYGFLRFYVLNNIGSNGGFVATGTQLFVRDTQLLPLFDNDLWTVRLSPSTQLPTWNSLSFSSGRIQLFVGKASDCTYKSTLITGSTSVYSGTFTSNFFKRFSAEGAFGTYYTILGGTTQSGQFLTGSTYGFSGSMQAYREFYQRLTDANWRHHILSPHAYQHNHPTGSYKFLYRYYPLGVDNIRHDHGALDYVTSSHPNQSFHIEPGSDIATFRNFGVIGDQDAQYSSLVERYYTYTPSIGGTNIRNTKIRIESSSLINQLSPTARSERASYDRAPIDSNRLAIVFSMADQINRDIFNQFGANNLDDYIGDPQYEFDTDYSPLKHLSNEYFKKYSQRNDINAFIRILSVYDYTFFDQIRQLVPGRADLVAGILIEPHILERPKIQVTKRPKVENPQWDKTIRFFEKDPFGEYISIETSASAEMDVEMTYKYVTSSISDPYEFSGESIHHIETAHQRTGICGIVDVYPNRYSGSQAPTQSIVDKMYVNNQCKYKLVEYHYSGSGTFPTRYLKQWYAAVSKSYGMYYSRSLHTTGYQIDECGTRNNSRYIGSKLTGAGFNIDSPGTSDGGPVVVIIESNPNNLFVQGKDDSGNLMVE